MTAQPGRRAAELGLRPLARFHSGAVTGDDPVTMPTAPIPATAKVLKRAGLTIDDIGVFEVNEAFASVPLAWEAETGADHARLNPLGGAPDDVRGRRHGQRHRGGTADRLAVTRVRSVKPKSSARTNAWFPSNLSL